MKMLIMKHLKLKKYPQNCELEATCVPNQIECNLSMRVYWDPPPPIKIPLTTKHVKTE